MKFKLIVLLTVIVSVLMSCSNYKYINAELSNKLVPGMKQSYVFDKYEKEFTFEFTDIGSQPYSVVIYRYELQSSKDIMYDTYIYDYFVVSYQNNVIHYWGFLDDFKRSNDINVQKLGEKICDKLIEIDK